MDWKRTVAIVILVLIAGLICYPLLRQGIPYAVFYIQSRFTKDETNVVAKCANIQWSVTSQDFADFGQLGTIDIGPVPARLRHHVTLTGAIDNEPIAWITVREYEPRQTFSKEKTSENISLERDKGIAKDAHKIIEVNKELYDRMYPLGWDVWGWLVTLPPRSTLSEDQFTDLANCYGKHLRSIEESFPLPIAAFLSLK